MRKVDKTGLKEGDALQLEVKGKRVALTESINWKHRQSIQIGTDIFKVKSFEKTTSSGIAQIGDEIMLGNNYPNPGNPATHID